MRLKKAPECQQIYVPIVTVGLDYLLPAVDGVFTVHLGDEVTIEVVSIFSADHVVRKTNELSKRIVTS